MYLETEGKISQAVPNFLKPYYFRSSHLRCSVKKGVLRNFIKFTGKHLCQRSFFNKVAGLACNFIKKESLAQVLPCEFFEISKNTFFYRTPPVAVSKCLTSSAKFNEIVFDRCKSPVMPFCL